LDPVELVGDADVGAIGLKVATTPTIAGLAGFAVLAVVDEQKKR